MADRDKLSAVPASKRRRGFLLTLGTGGVAVAAAVIKPISEATQEEQAAPASDAGQGYRETAHVRDYYRTTKI